MDMNGGASGQGREPVPSQRFHHPAAHRLLPQSFLELDSGGRIRRIHTFGQEAAPEWVRELLGIGFFRDIFSPLALEEAEARYKGLVASGAEARFLTTLQVVHEGRTLGLSMVFTYSGILDVGYVMVGLLDPSAT